MNRYVGYFPDNIFYELHSEWDWHNFPEHYRPVATAMEEKHLNAWLAKCRREATGHKRAIGQAPIVPMDGPLEPFEVDGNSHFLLFDYIYIFFNNNLQRLNEKAL